MAINVSKLDDPRSWEKWRASGAIGTCETALPTFVDAGNGTCKHGNAYFCGLCRAEAAPKCKHGNPWYCGLCKAEKAPKCKHGTPYWCGFCGKVGVWPPEY